MLKERLNKTGFSKEYEKLPEYKKIVLEKEYKNLQENLNKIINAMELIKKEDRTERNVLKFSFLGKLVSLIEHFKSNFLGIIDIGSLITRSSFEMLLFLKEIKKSEDLKKFNYLAIEDEKELITKFKKVVTENIERGFLKDKHINIKKVLIARDKHLDYLIDKYSLQKTRRWKIWELAKNLDFAKEYEIFYKFFCTYAHPTRLSIIQQMPYESFIEHWFCLTAKLNEYTNLILKEL